MIDRSDRTFGIAIVSCDAPGCPGELQLEGIDGHQLPMSEVVKELADNGWLNRKIGNEWCQFCDEGCLEKFHSETRS